jgi:hypothetical protein
MRRAWQAARQKFFCAAMVIALAFPARFGKMRYARRVEISHKFVV